MSSLCLPVYTRWGCRLDGKAAKSFDAESRITTWPNSEHAFQKNKARCWLQLLHTGSRLDLWLMDWFIYLLNSYWISWLNVLFNRVNIRHGLCLEREKNQPIFRRGRDKSKISVLYTNFPNKSKHSIEEIEWKSLPSGTEEPVFTKV